MRVRIEVVNLAAGELVIEIEIIRVVEIVVHQWLLWDNHFWGGELVVVAAVVAAAVARVVAALVLLVRAPVAVWYWLQR